MVRSTAGATLILSAIATIANAQTVPVRVTVENLAPQNGVALSPFTAAFHDGTFDAFSSGGTATPGLRNIAELGDGTVFLTEFGAQEAQGVSGTIIGTTNSFGPGIILPGGSGSMVFNLNPTLQRFMTFGSMVLPSNDRFIGNDSPMGIQLFNGGGAFVGQTQTLMGMDTWEAGTEVDGQVGAAFIQGQDPTVHMEQQSMIMLNNDLSVYTGATTPAGYTFGSQPDDATPIARITFTVIPSPGAAGLLMLMGPAVLLRRR